MAKHNLNQFDSIRLWKGEAYPGAVMVEDLQFNIVVNYICQRCGRNVINHAPRHSSHNRGSDGPAVAGTGDRCRTISLAPVPAETKSLQIIVKCGSTDAAACGW